MAPLSVQRPTARLGALLLVLALWASVHGHAASGHEPVLDRAEHSAEAACFLCAVPAQEAAPVELAIQLAPLVEGSALALAPAAPAGPQPAIPGARGPPLA